MLQYIPFCSAVYGITHSSGNRDFQIATTKKQKHESDEVLRCVYNCVVCRKKGYIIPIVLLFLYL